MNVAVIPARGGSKRIPRKNIKDFCGKPIIFWPIEIAKKSELFDHILVSTDDKEIAKIANSLGVKVPFVRPNELSDDYSSTTEVISHAVSWMLKEGWQPKNVCCIYPTSVFLTVDDLWRGFNTLVRGNWSYTFSATSFKYPIFRSFKETDNGGIEMFFPEHFESRSQDLPEAFHDATQFYWGLPDAWLDNLKLFEKHSSPIKIPNWRVSDIDTEEDWKRAELLFNIINN